MMSMTDTDTPEGIDGEIETTTSAIIRDAIDRIPVREVALLERNEVVVGDIIDTLGPRHAPDLDLLGCLGVGGTKRMAKAAMATAALASTGLPIDAS